MEEMDKAGDIMLKRKAEQVHRTLAHSYSFYFLLFLLSIALDIFYPVRIFKHTYTEYFGLLILILGSVLVVWAQSTSRNLKKHNLSKETFSHGPYCYTRTPTHFGLFLLMLGFGIVANAFFVVLFTVVSYVVTRLTFVRKEERILTERYGASYEEYKKQVKL